MCICTNSRTCLLCLHYMCECVNYISFVTTECVQGSVLMQLSVNIRSPSQQWMLNGINGKNSCISFYTWGLHCWWGNFYHLTMLREGKTAAFYKSIHLGTAYSGSWAQMEIPFLNWDGGSLMTLGMGIKYFNSSGYKKCRERTRSMCPKHFWEHVVFCI